MRPWLLARPPATRRRGQLGCLEHYAQTYPQEYLAVFPHLSQQPLRLLLKIHQNSRQRRPSVSRMMPLLIVEVDRLSEGSHELEVYGAILYHLKLRKQILHTVSLYQVQWEAKGSLTSRP